ncbi:MAG TPA: hypothetical protein VLH10_07310 [Yinghuangia sp.]|uniref:hypothetical protein n=1 Tax=Yinghuangia sp. YIM S10712 TaxID=3436930 RepID=UPI002C87D588|nr:hypothetical protein [Yinghuangia sp.]
MQMTCACGEPQAVSDFLTGTARVTTTAIVLAGIVLAVGLVLLWAGPWLSERFPALFPGTADTADAHNGIPHIRHNAADAETFAFFAWPDAAELDGDGTRR